MKKDFKTFLMICETLKETGSFVVPESFDWAKAISKTLPNLELSLPQMKKQSKIEMIADKKNPIYVQLTDGSKLFFTYDEFKRIEGKPEKGKTMVLFMQRLGNDMSEMPSKITRCQVI